MRYRSCRAITIFGVVFDGLENSPRSAKHSGGEGRCTQIRTSEFPLPRLFISLRPSPTSTTPAIPTIRGTTRMTLSAAAQWFSPRAHCPYPTVRDSEWTLTPTNWLKHTSDTSNSDAPHAMTPGTDVPVSLTTIRHCPDSRDGHGCWLRLPVGCLRCTRIPVGSSSPRCDASGFGRLLPRCSGSHPAASPSSVRDRQPLRALHPDGSWGVAYEPTGSTTTRSLVARWRVRRGSRTADCRGVHGFRVARPDARGWADREPSTPSADRVWRYTLQPTLSPSTRGSGLCRSPRTPVDAIGRIRLSSGVCRISRIRSRIPS